MKKIWIDGYEANVKQRLGSGQVAYQLLLNLEKIDHTNDYTILLPNEPLEDLPKERKGWTYMVIKPSKLWTRIALPLTLARVKEKPDLFLSPTHYLPRFFPVKKIVTIFDLAFLKYPQMYEKKDLFKLTNWTKYSAKAADHILTISQSSKKDIVSEYGIKKEKVTVVYPGYEEKVYFRQKDKEKITEVLEKYGILQKYIIYIGTIQPRKNLVRLIEAFSRVDSGPASTSSQRGESQEGLQLVIAGKTKGEGRQAWMFDDILEAPKKFGVSDRVIFTNFVPSRELPYLISGATAFILPSLYEGFGIPVVEAMACGTPVIVSNVSSLPEVVSDAGLLINPNSTDQIEQAIRTISTDSKLREKLSKKGLEQVKKFSWKRMAKRVTQVLEEV